MLARWSTAAALVLLVNAAACDSVVIVIPAPGDDVQAGGSGTGKPSSGGAAGVGGTTVDGGASSVGGDSSSGGSGGMGGDPNAGGGSCVADPALPTGEAVAIGSGLNRPVGIALVGDDIYVTQTGEGGADGSLVRLPKAGGELEVLATEQNQPWAITADAEYVYWVNHGEGDNGSLHRVSLATKVVDLLAEKLRYPWGIAVHAGSVYATELNNNRVIAIRPNLSLDVVTSAFTGLPIAVDDTGVYVGVIGLDSWQESISHVDTQGTPAMLYAQPSPSEILLLDGNDLYFSDQGHLHRGTRDGAPITTLASVSMLGGVTAAFADCYVYFAVQQDTYVGRVAVDTGDLQVLAPNEGLPAAIAVDDDAIYWVNQLDGTVMRLEK